MSDTPALAAWLWQQQWLPLRFKKNIYKRLGKSGMVPDAPFEMDFFGLRYQGNLRNGIEFAMFYYGAFEKPLLFFLRDSLEAISKRRQRPTLFCDIGANIGQHSLFMSRHADRVIAFEPFAEVSARLEHHIALNSIDNIELHKLGLSDSNGTLPFFAPTGSNQGVGSFSEDSLQRGNQAAGELQIARADDFFAQHPPPALDLVKIDVEGFEQKVLQGMQASLVRHRPLLVCEITYGEALSFQSQAQFLDCLPEGYRLFMFDTRKADGSTARRKGARAKRTGAYRLTPALWRDRDQDDVIAVPQELVDYIPQRSS